MKKTGMMRTPNRILWADYRLVAKHKFVWTSEGFERINRYGEKVMEPDAVGASAKEAREVLIEAIEGFIKLLPDSFDPCGTFTFPNGRGGLWGYVDNLRGLE